MLRLLLPPIENIINRALLADPAARAKIAAIQHQAIEINCIDWKIKFYIFCGDGTLQFEKKSFRTADTVVTGTLNHFFNLFMKGASNKTLFEYPIDIVGNTHNLEILRNAFENLDLDVEEKLSSLLGDALAHKLCFHVKKTHHNARDTQEKLKEQIKEYIYCEAKHFPTRKKVEKFYTDIARLREDVERMEIKIKYADSL